MQSRPQNPDEPEGVTVKIGDMTIELQDFDAEVISATGLPPVIPPEQIRKNADGSLTILMNAPPEIKPLP